MTFPSNYIFGLISDFWRVFEDREDLENVWDGYIQKADALDLLLKQADLSKSLLTIPLFDKDAHRYYDFSKMEPARTGETNPPYYVFPVDQEIFFVRSLTEAIDGLGKTQRTLNAPQDFTITDSLASFLRGVGSTDVGATTWTNGSDLVTGTNLDGSVAADDILQAPDTLFYKVLEVVNDTTVRVTGATFYGEDLGPGDGVTTAFQLATTSFVNPAPSGVAKIKIYFDGVEITTGFSVTTGGLVTFGMAPGANVASITADYYTTYPGVSAVALRTVKESRPERLLSRATFLDRRSVFTNFGVAIDHDKPTSLQYLNEVRGIYFARWKGPTPFAMSLGGGILIGLPFAERGIVQRIISTIPQSVTVNGLVHPVQDPLAITVTIGQELTEDFNLVTDGIRTSDLYNDPVLFNLAPLKTDPAKFFTFFVIVKGTYATYVATQTGQPIDYAALKKFVLDVKPAYADCMILTDIDFITDQTNLFIGAVDVTNLMVAEQTSEFNYVNFSIVPDFLLANSLPDEAAVAAVAPMSADELGLAESIEIIDTILSISTLENNLVNFGVSPPGPENLDECSVLMEEALAINEAVGTPPGSFIPPFTPGALIYSF